MQRIRHIFLFLLFLSLGAGLVAQEDFRKSAPEAAPAPAINLGDFVDFKLDNGLHVILVENHKLPRVSFQLYVDVPLHGEGDQTGVSNLAGSLLRTGTTERSKAELDEAIDFIGANLSTNARGMFGSTITKHRETLLSIMSEVLLQPSFPAEEFEKLKRQTASGLAQAANNPTAIASRVGDVLRYGKDHPYGELTTEATLENISLTDARAYYERYFHPNNSYLVMVGDLTLAETRRLAEAYFGNWETGKVDKFSITPPDKPRSRQVSFVARPGAVQSVVRITYPVNLKPGTKDAIQAGLLTNIILGSSFNGRLFKNLREDKGYTYGASSRIDSDPYVGYFDASADVRNEVTDSAVAQFLYELDRVGIEKVSEEELALGKAQIMG
jgi:zinc protease